MSKRRARQKGLSESDVIEDIQHQPLIFMQLAQNALTVAESFRANYLKNTADFISKLRRAIEESPDEREETILTVHQVNDTSWSDVSGEVVTFIDGGVGRIQISSQVPILLRGVSSYACGSSSCYGARFTQKLWRSETN